MTTPRSSGFVLAAALTLCPIASVLGQSSKPTEAPEHGIRDTKTPETKIPNTKIKVPGVSELTITGEYRLRYENRLNYDLNRDATDKNDFFSQRLRLNVAPKFNEQFEGFFQFQDVRNWGSESSTVATSAPGFDVHQGWIQMKDAPYIGGTGRLGRQAIALGDERLIGSLEWASQGRAFDGYLHTWQEESSFTAHAFYLHVNETSIRARYDDAYVIGLYTSVDSIENAELDLYAIFLNAEETTAGGNEHRLTLGARWEQRFADLELGAEFATQTGDKDGIDIPIFDTHALHAHATYHFGKEKETPSWARIEFNRASGNDPNSNDNERFNTLFPTAHAHLGMMDLAFWENVQHGMIQFGFKPAGGHKFAVSYHHFESVEESDVFRGPANAFPGGANNSNKIGSEFDLLYHRTFDTKPFKTYLQIGYGVFLPGNGAEDALGRDDLAHFVYVMGGLKF